MKKFKIIYLFVILIAFAACDRDELLDIAPYGKIIPETVDDYRFLLNERSDKVATYNMDGYLSDNIKVPEGTYTDYLTSYSSRYYHALTWDEIFGQEQEEDDNYNQLYEDVLNSNVLIEEIETAEGDPAEKDKMIAELKVHRAFAYFSLVNLYSTQYVESTAATAKGVPVKLDSKFYGATPRVSVKEVYDLVLKDLNEAIESNALEASVPQINWQAWQAGAYALLARVRLQMMNYPEALDAANKCLNMYDTLYDFDSMEADIRNYDNVEVILLKEKSGLLPFGLNTYAADELIALYDEYNDLRISDRYRKDDAGYYFDRGISWQGYMNYTGCSVAEMYLIKAECHARAGQTTEALNAVNRIREKRFRSVPDTTEDKTYVVYDTAGVGSIDMNSYNAFKTLKAADSDAALDLVKEERRREMADQGMRLFDIKRYMAEGDVIEIKRTIEGDVRTPANNNRLIVPIAQIVIQYAPEIEQSDR